MDKKVSVSVSIGIASVFDSEDDETEAIHRADQAMYTANVTVETELFAVKMNCP